MRRPRWSLAFLTTALVLMAFPASAVEVYETIYGEFVPVENPRLFIVSVAPGTDLPGEVRTPPPVEFPVKPGDPPIFLGTGSASVAASSAGLQGGIAGSGVGSMSSGFGRSPGNLLDLRVRHARKALDG